MDYRDERDAMRGRIENLEQDLASANRELEERRRNQDPERIAELEKQLADARHKLDQISGELARVKGGQVPTRTGRLVLGGFVVVLIAIGFVFPTRHAAPPRTAAVEQPPLPAAREEQQPAPASPPKRRVNARWTGSVTRAAGIALAPGTACTIDATLTGDDRGLTARELAVTCGGKPLYRSTDALEGMSMSSSGAEEEPGPTAGTHVYTLAYHDKGTRTGARNEVSLDTSAKTGIVWRDSVSAWRVEIAIAPKSAAVPDDAPPR